MTRVVTTTVTAAVCDLCDGEGTLLVLDLGRRTTTGELPCPGCCCAVCGKPTDTPPVCAHCDAVEDAAAQRRSDR